MSYRTADDDGEQLAVAIDVVNEAPAAAQKLIVFHAGERSAYVLLGSLWHATRLSPSLLS
jgi:hypothetical protein